MAYTTINKSSDFFNTKTYSGTTNSSDALTGIGFQPDLVWLKSRSNAGWHWWTDSVRGVTKTIYSNEVTAEETNADGVTAFGADGFTIGNNSDINGSGKTFTSWNWKAGTTGSGTTGGSGTGKAYSYSVNTTAGFSIVKYIGNGTNGHTIPHHLGAVPKMVIEKVTIGNTNNWGVYHHSMGNTKAMYLDGNSTQTTDSFLNNTTPTSNYVTLGSNMSNQDGKTFIMYSFAEKTGYSKFGIYKGTSSTDGAFIYTGFKPAFFMAKCIDNQESWYIFDNKREGYNVENRDLYADNNSVEGSADWLDILSNGIKFRYNSIGLNGSSNNYIYMAFAEAPLVGSNNVPCTAR